jgi:hypothetical protein
MNAVNLAVIVFVMAIFAYMILVQELPAEHANTVPVDPVIRPAQDANHALGEYVLMMIAIVEHAETALIVNVLQMTAIALHASFVEMD